MKRFIVFLAVALMPLMIQAKDIYTFRLTEMATKQKTGNRWGNWTDWEKIDEVAVINIDRLKIYLGDSSYTITKCGETEEQKDGGVILNFNCYDNDNDDCNVRLRVTGDGDWQMYLDYDSFSIALNMEEME